MGKIQMDPGIFANWNFVSLIKLLYGRFFIEVTWLLRSSKLYLISPNNITEMEFRPVVGFWELSTFFNPALLLKQIEISILKLDWNASAH